MTIRAKYSKTTGGIYPLAAYKTFPTDAKDIPDNFYEQYLDGAISGFDVVNEVVIAIEPTPAAPLSKTKFTSLEWLDRFTQQEQLAVVAASMTSSQVKLVYDRMLAASYVDINDPRTEAGIDALIAANLIAANRKAALLQPEEVQA